MKTENTLRMVRNSLLCFSMALGAGLLAACGNDSSGGGGSGGASTFPAYFVDAAVEGAEYSGPTNPVKNTTREDGEFEASEGVFEFSVGATPLGSVRLNSDWENSQVTPADFIGVDSDAEVIAIARVLQGLDGDPNPRNGISISQTHRGLTVDLFANAVVTASLAEDAAFTFVATGANASVTLNFPTRTAARDHLIATRQCLYNGVYAGDYRSTVASSSTEGKSYFVLEPVADRATGIDFPIGTNRDGNVDSRIRNYPPLAEVGVRGSVIVLASGSAGATLSFVTPRLVNGIWTNGDGDSGIYRLTLMEGDPTANRRVIGVDNRVIEGNNILAGLYILDHFADNDNGGSFRGQYYDVTAGQSSVLLLTIAGGTWPAPAAVAATTLSLTLSGTYGGDAMTVTMGVIRESNNHGVFEGPAGDTESLSGTWCDLVQPLAVVGGNDGDNALVGSAQSEIEADWRVESLAMSHSRIGGDVSAHRLSHYLDSGFPANTAIEGIQILG